MRFADVGYYVQFCVGGAGREDGCPVGMGVGAEDTDAGLHIQTNPANPGLLDKDDV